MVAGSINQTIFNYYHGYDLNYGIKDFDVAYFDDDRLENIFQYLNTNFKDNQIIIFTCSNREKEILEKMNIDFNFSKI